MGAPKGNKFAKGNKGGRPTLFKKRYIEDIKKFFDIEPYKKEIIEKSSEYFVNGKIKRKNEKFKLTANPLPTLYRFSKKIGVSYWTVWNWAETGKDDKCFILKEKEAEYTKTELKEIKEQAKAIKEFSNAYKEAKELQKEFLISLGLSGATPPASYIFTAKNITDMRDKIEAEVFNADKRINEDREKFS